jgi:hypothetical protein
MVNDNSRLPRPWANPALHDPLGRRLTTPDLWFDDVALAVMVHSRVHHSGVLDWEATVAADEDLRTAGIDVVAVTPASIAAEPGRVRPRSAPHTSGPRADRGRSGFSRCPEPGRGRPPKRLPKRLDGRDHDRMAATRAATRAASGPLRHPRRRLLRRGRAD